MTGKKVVGDQDEDRLDRLDTARWLSALAVVMLHTASQVLGTQTAYGSPAWLAANFYDSAVRWCVPVFVMISGALLLDENKPVDFQSFLRRRSARILIPLAFWTLFYLLWRLLQDWLDHGHAAISSDLHTVATVTPYYHLWYLYMIVGLYLSAPFVHALYVRGTPAMRLTAVAIILGVAIAWSGYRQWTDQGRGFFLTWFLPYLGYFIAGRLMIQGSLRVRLPLLLLCGAIGATAWGVYSLSDHDTINVYFYDYFSLTVPLMSLAVFELLVRGPKLPRLSRLAPLTFGVYLVHPVFLDIARRLGAYTGGKEESWTLPLIAVLVFLISLALSWMLRQGTLTRRLI